MTTKDELSVRAFRGLLVCFKQRDLEKSGVSEWKDTEADPVYPESFPSRADVAKLTYAEIHAQDHIGYLTLAEIAAWLFEEGLYLRGDPPWLQTREAKWARKVDAAIRFVERQGYTVTKN